GIWQIPCGKYGGISQSKIPSLNPIIIGGILQGNCFCCAPRNTHYISFLSRVGEEGRPSKFRIFCHLSSFN
ncbi:unnamed protein product, partial [Prunus brigantina]